MPDQTSRVTNANSPVEFLAPQNPLLNSPNKITQADFKGWVQERGLYFWGSFDSKYQPVLGMKDPGEPEAKGALVYARDGKGMLHLHGPFVLPAIAGGSAGAYRLFVNLLSQTRRTPRRRNAERMTEGAPSRNAILERGETSGWIVARCPRDGAVSPKAGFRWGAIRSGQRASRASRLG